MICTILAARLESITINDGNLSLQSVWHIFNGEVRGTTIDVAKRIIMKICIMHSNLLITL